MGLRDWVAGERRTHDEVRDAVYLFTGDAAAKQGRFWLLLILSTVIATAGIVSDSTATVIGAMIIAPLAIPIQGVAVATAGGEIRPLLLSAAILVGGALTVIAVASLVAWVLPTLHAPAQNSQITGRTAPTVVDLVAATATGLAGTLAVARRDIGDILPGVAIAISLVPPLAVVGVTGVESDWSGALGALLLFLTNVLAIIVAGIVVFAGLGVVTASLPRLRRRAALVIGIAGVVIVGALTTATIRTVQLSTWRDSASDVATTFAKEEGEQLVRARFEGDTLVLLFEGSGDPERDDELPERLRGAVPSGTPVAVNRVAGRRREVGEVP